PAGDVELGLVMAEDLRGGDEERRIDAVCHDHWAGFSTRPPSFAILGAMPARHHVDAELARPVQHLAIDADIDDARIRIADERDVSRTGVGTAIPRPEGGRGIAGHVDLVA